MIKNFKIFITCYIFNFQLNLNCGEMTALITQPELDPQSNGRAIDEIFFEDYGFNAIYRKG